MAVTEVFGKENYFVVNNSISFLKLLSVTSDFEAYGQCFYRTIIRVQIVCVCVCVCVCVKVRGSRSTVVA